MISLCSEPCLFLKPSTLIDRVIQFRERICNLLPIANGFKAFDESLLIRVFLSERTQFNRIVGDKSGDRKSTRLNSSHVAISYAVFCLKKKNKQHRPKTQV